MMNQYARSFADYFSSLPVQNGLKEPRLGDALRPYYNKWRKLVKNHLVSNPFIRGKEDLLSRLPPEETEEGETEKGEESQEESDSSAHEVLRSIYLSGNSVYSRTKFPVLDNI